MARYPLDPELDEEEAPSTPRPTGAVIQAAQLSAAPDRAPLPAPKVDIGAFAGEQPAPVAMPTAAPAFTAPPPTPADPRIQAAAAESGAFDRVEVEQPRIAERRYGDQRLEAQRQQRGQAAGAFQQRQEQSEADKAMAGKLRGLKAAGVEIDTDPLTGEQRPKMDEKGQVVYKPKVIEAIAQSADGTFVTRKQDSTGRVHEIPLKPQIDKTTGEESVLSEDGVTRHSLGINQTFLQKQQVQVAAQERAFYRAQLSATTQKKKALTKQIEAMSSQIVGIDVSESATPEMLAKKATIQKNKDALTRQIADLSAQEGQFTAAAVAANDNFLTKKGALLGMGAKQLAETNPGAGAAMAEGKAPVSVSIPETDQPPGITQLMTTPVFKALDSGKKVEALRTWVEQQVAWRKTNEPGFDEKAFRSQYPDRPGAWGAVRELFSGIKSAVLDQFPEDMARIWRGGDVSLHGDSWADRMIAEQEGDKRARGESLQSLAGTETLFGALDQKDLQTGPASIATSIATGVGGAAAGGQAGAVAGPYGAAVGGIVGAGALTGAAFYRLAKDQFRSQVRDMILDRGVNVTEAQWKQIGDDIESEAQKYGLWEAGPEALSNAFTAGLFRGQGKVLLRAFGQPAVKGAAMAAVTGVVKKFGLELAEELATETTTQYGQGAIEAKVGLRDKAPTVGEAFQEVKGATIVGTILQGGGFAAYNKIRTARENGKLLREETASNADFAARHNEANKDTEGFKPITAAEAPAVLATTRAARDEATIDGYNAVADEVDKLAIEYTTADGDPAKQAEIQSRIDEAELRLTEADAEVDAMTAAATEAQAEIKAEKVPGDRLMLSGAINAERGFPVKGSEAQALMGTKDAEGNRYGETVKIGEKKTVRLSAAGRAAIAASHPAVAKLFTATSNKGSIPAKPQSGTTPPAAPTPTQGAEPAAAPSGTPANPANPATASPAVSPTSSAQPSPAAPAPAVKPTNSAKPVDQKPGSATPAAPTQVPPSKNQNTGQGPSAASDSSAQPAPAPEAAQAESTDPEVEELAQLTASGAKRTEAQSKRIRALYKSKERAKAYADRVKAISAEKPQGGEATPGSTAEPPSTSPAPAPSVKASLFTGTEGQKTMRTLAGLKAKLVTTTEPRGMAAHYDAEGNLSLIVDEVAFAERLKNREEGQRAGFTAAALREELVHLASMEAVKREWIQRGKKSPAGEVETFGAAFEREYSRAAEELEKTAHTDGRTLAEHVREIYGESPNGRLEGAALAAEWVRQLTQQNEGMVPTEGYLRQFVDKILTVIKGMLANRATWSQPLQDVFDSTNRVLKEADKGPQKEKAAPKAKPAAVDAEGRRRVRLGKNPQTWVVLRQMPPTKADQPGEVYFEVQNERTNEIEVVSGESMIEVGAKKEKSAEATPAPKSKADQAFKDKIKGALDGLFLPAETATVEQEPIPQDRVAPLINLAFEMNAQGVTTPRELIDLLDDISQGKARKFAKAIWRIMQSVGQAPDGEQDWPAVFKSLDSADNEVDAVEVSPEIAPTPESGPAVVEVQADPAETKAAEAKADASPVAPMTMRVQKEYLLDALDNAIAATTVERNPDWATEEGRADNEALREMERYDSPIQKERPQNAGNAQYAAWQAKVDDLLQPLYDKYGIPKTIPRLGASTLYQSESRINVTLNADRRLERLRDAIKNRDLKTLPRIRIEIPGDGTFTIINTKETLREFRKKAAKLFPSVPLKPNSIPVPSAPKKESAIPPLGKPKNPNDLVKIASIATSNDPTREVLGFVMSDGQNLIGIDGRRLLRIQASIGGTEAKPVLIDPATGKTVKRDDLKFPDWKQVVPRDYKDEFTIDTAQAIKLLYQALQMTSERTNSAKIWIAENGELGVASSTPDEGAYIGGTESKKPKFLSAFNPAFLIDGLKAARAMGHAEVKMRVTDDQSPASLEAPKFQYVIMPMRISLPGESLGLPAEDVTGNPKPGPKIVSTAILLPDGSVVTGKTWNAPHASFTTEAIEAGADMDSLLDPKSALRGFVVEDEHGKKRFATRKEAFTIAGQAGQRATDNTQGELNSQDLKDGGSLYLPADNAAPFYSELERFIGEKVKGPVSAEQLTATLKGKVKQDEIDWMLGDLLKRKAGQRITPKEIQDEITANGVLVREVVKDGAAPNGFTIIWDDIPQGGNVADYHSSLRTGDRYETKKAAQDYADSIADDEDNQGATPRVISLAELPAENQWHPLAEQATPATKFAQYQLPGGTNYRELLFTLPVAPEQEINRSKASDFKSSHFDEPNIVLHMRVNDRETTDGKSMLFAEELQSDWGQTQRKAGTRADEQDVRELESKENLLALELKKVREQARATEDEEGNYDPAMEAKVKAASDAYVDAATARRRAQDGVPDMPFHGQGWKRLGLKKLISRAVAEGKDAVGWTTGEQQAERYDLSKQVNALHVQITDEGIYGIEATQPDGKRVNLGEFTGDKLEETIGKDLAARVVEEVKEPGVEKDYSGLDLKVGSKGMEGFYDRELVNIANDLGKKHGARVEKARITGEAPTAENGSTWKIFQDKSEAIKWAEENLNGQKFSIKQNPGGLGGFIIYNENTYEIVRPIKKINVEVWSLPITPSLRDMVRDKGFSLFLPAEGTMAADIRLPGAQAMADEMARTLPKQQDARILERAQVGAAKLETATPFERIRTGMLYREAKRRRLAIGANAVLDAYTGTTGAINLPAESSGPAPESELVKSMRTALAALPEKQRLAVQMHVKGSTDEQIAAATGLSAIAAHNAYMTGLGRLRAARVKAKTLGATFEAAKAEPRSQRKIGRPDLANPARGPQSRRLVDALDAEREAAGKPTVKKDRDTQEAANAEWDAKGQEGIAAELLEIVERNGQLNDVQTINSKRLIDSETLSAVRRNDLDSLYRVTLLGNAYRDTGSEQARAFRWRRDAVMTPAERFRDALGQAITKPSHKQQKALDKAKKDGDLEKQKRIVKQLVAEIEAIKDKMRKLGVDLDTMSDDEIRDISKDPVKAARIMRIAGQAKGGFFDKLLEFWVMSILSGLGTQVANVTGNTVNTALNLGPQRFVEAMLNLVVNDPKSAKFGEFLPMARGFFSGIQRGLKNAALSWRTESPIFEQDVLNADGATTLDIHPKAIQGMKGRIIRTPGRLLGAADDLSKSITGSMEVGAQAYRIATAEGLTGQALTERMAQLQTTPTEVIRDYRAKVTDTAEVEARAKSLAGNDTARFDDQVSDAWEKARNEAALALAEEDGYTTQAWETAVASATDLAFQSPSEFADMIIRLRSKFPILTFVIPFTRTPLNIFKTAIRRLTPLGSLALAYRLAREGAIKIGWSNGEPRYTVTEAVKHTAEQVLAVGLVFVLAGLAGPGDDDLPTITGTLPFTPGGRGERDLANRTAPPQSVRIGGKWFSYARIEPFATGFGAIIDGINRIGRARAGQDTTKVLGDTFQNAVSMTTNKTFMRGISDIVQATQDGAHVSSWASNFITSWVPNILKSSSREADPTVRETAVWGSGDSFRQMWMRRLAYKALPLPDAPLASAPPEAKYDLWGRPLTKDTDLSLEESKELEKRRGLAPGTDTLTRMLSPARTEKDMPNKLDLLLVRFNQAHPNDEIFPAPPTANFVRTITVTDPKTGATRKEKKSVPMTEKEFSHFLRLSGRMAAAKLDGETLNYKKPDERDIEIVTKAIREARQSVRAQLWNARLASGNLK